MRLFEGYFTVTVMNCVSFTTSSAGKRKGLCMRFIKSVVLTLGMMLRAFAQNSMSPLNTDAVAVLNPFDPGIVDRTQDPCNDFYKFVCSKWQAANPIPPDQSNWGNWIQPAIMEWERAAQYRDARG